VPEFYAYSMSEQAKVKTLAIMQKKGGLEMANRSFAISMLVAACMLVQVRFGSTQEITVRNEVDFSFMDPALITNSNDYTIAVNIYSGLLKYNVKTMEPEPDLAKSWNVSTDGLTYTFQLRNNVQWHKGYGKFTARDVKYSFDRIIDNRAKSRYRTDFSNVREVQVVDDYTVKIHMKAPDMSFIRKVLYYRPGYIVNQKAIESLGTKYNSSPIGTGPFVFDRWEPGSKVVLVANKNYFLAPPKLQKATFLVINDEAVAQLALEKGELDLVVFQSLDPLDSLKQARGVKEKSITLDVEPELNITFLSINNCRKPFDDIRVRQALHLAINKDDLIAAAYGGAAPKAANFLNPRFFGYKKDVKAYDYNTERAKKLLAEAGLPTGFETNLLYHPQEPWKHYAPIIQEQLRQVGIRVKLNLLDRATVENLRQKGDYDLMYGSISRPPDPDIMFSTYLLSTNAPYPNYLCYKNKEVDGLIAQGNREPNTEKRKNIYYRLQDIVADETPMVPISYRTVLAAWRSNVKNYTFNSLASYNLYNVTVQGKK
jgi:ABC-type transport system substrate-binding protein